MEIKNKVINGKTGGHDEITQTGETAIVKGKLLKTPLEMCDVSSYTGWIVGTVEVKTREIGLDVVPDRSTKTTAALFKMYIEKETTRLTDGHRSHPEAVYVLNGVQHVVIRGNGFKNEKSETTNSIEDVWKHHKYEMSLIEGNKENTMFKFL